MSCRRGWQPVRLVVYDTITLIWTVTGTTADTIAATKRINTTATTAASAKIAVHAASCLESAGAGSRRCRQAGHRKVAPTTDEVRT